MVVLHKQRARYINSLVPSQYRNLTHATYYCLTIPENGRSNILRNISSYQATRYRIPRGLLSFTMDRFSVLISTCL